MAAVLMIPSALLLAAAAAASGFALSRGEQHSLFFQAARYLLLTVPILSIFGPLLLPAADRTNPVRLLLLPIPRSTLYVAQSSSAFGDVWVLLMLPIVLFLPIGLLAGGAFGAAVLSLAGGVLLVLLVVGLSSLSTSLLHLVVRNRRRGELLALLFIRDSASRSACCQGCCTGVGSCGGLKTARLARRRELRSGWSTRRRGHLRSIRPSST